MKKTFIRLLSILVFALIAFAGFCYYRGPDGVSLLNRLKQGFSNIIENRHCEEDGKPCQIMQEPVEIEEEQKDIAEQD
ncbi:MAG: hypothetical protein LBU27_03250 [Candidatus Peribacteria bacterium]|jgi:hypothetical protein|nr:hypothetical protein [Candidatus Peribacteria bacterium]